MLLLTIACGGPPARALDDIAEGYVRAALALAKHQPSLVEHWRGSDAWRPGPRVPVAETRGDIARLIRDLEGDNRTGTSPNDRARTDYLRRQLDALDFAARRLLGEQTSFADEIVRAYGVPLPAADGVRLNAARERLAELLPGSGSLGERHAAFRRSVTVRSGHEAGVLGAALDACRARTREHMALPPDESVELRLGADSAWDGFARYDGNHRSIVEISGRSSLDVSRALRLACHEAYPGHHVQYVLLEAAAAAQARPELLLQPAFGPHLLMAEGAAEAGADLAFSPSERVQLYRDVLLPRAGLSPDRAAAIVAIETEVLVLESVVPDVLGAYLDSRASREATIAALGDAAVMEPESLIAFAERQRTRAIAYVLGRHAVTTWLSHQSGDPWQHLARLFSGPFSTDIRMEGTALAVPGSRLTSRHP